MQKFKNQSISITDKQMPQIRRNKKYMSIILYIHYRRFLILLKNGKCRLTKRQGIFRPLVLYA